MRLPGVRRAGHASVERVARRRRARCTRRPSTKSPRDAATIAKMPKNRLQREPVGEQDHGAPHVGAPELTRRRLHRAASSAIDGRAGDASCHRPSRAAATSSGRNTSTRDPKRMSPMRSPCSTCSPSRLYVTMRRAISPAICRTRTRAAAGLDADRRLLVLEARLLDRRVEELAGIVVHVAHRALNRIPVHVHVEHVHEDRDARRASVHERRLVDLGDHARPCRRPAR